MEGSVDVLRFFVELHFKAKKEPLLCVQRKFFAIDRFC